MMHKPDVTLRVTFTVTFLLALLQTAAAFQCSVHTAGVTAVTLLFRAKLHTLSCCSTSAAVHAVCYQLHALLLTAL
jgi:hypothetical protein